MSPASNLTALIRSHDLEEKQLSLAPDTACLGYHGRAFGCWCGMGNIHAYAYRMMGDWPCRPATNAMVASRTRDEI